MGRRDTTIHEPNLYKLFVGAVALLYILFALPQPRLGPGSPPKDI